MNKQFLILGGYGTTGRLIAELLLQETDVQLVLAGRNREKADSCVKRFNENFAGNRVSAARIDAADPQSLQNAFDQVDLVIVASSTTDYTENVAKAAIKAHIDYLDTQLSTVSKLNSLRALKNEIKEADCCFITDGGFHPGLPAALVRYAASHFDRIKKAHIGSAINLNWKALSLSNSTINELIEEFKHYQPLAFQNEGWKKLGWNDYKTFNFGAQIGNKYCVPMMLEEMRALPSFYPSLQETGFFVAGFHWFTDYIIMPIGMAALKIWPKKAVTPVGKVFYWGLRTFCKPPYKTVLQLEASGIKNEKQKNVRITLAHEDGYFMTAVPVVACLLQYLKGSIRKPGLWFQANIVDPNQILQDMERMGINIEIGDTIQL